MIALAMLLALPIYGLSAEEVSPGGSVIYEYENVTPDTSAPQHEAVHVEDIQNALEPLLGENFVCHELTSTTVHLDVLVFAPTPSRNQWTFVTSGMSDKRMAVPEGLDPDEYGYAELVIAVPADWFSKGADGKIPDAELQDGTKYWPIRTLKFLGRFVHEYRTWFWESHTIPNGNPAEPYSAQTSMDGALLAPLSNWPEQYRTIKASDGSVINLFAVIPLYPDEMQAKLDLGYDTIMPALIDAGVTERVSLSRPSVAPNL